MDQRREFGTVGDMQLAQNFVDCMYFGGDLGKNFGVDTVGDMPLVQNFVDCMYFGEDLGKNFGGDFGKYCHFDYRALDKRRVDCSALD